MSVRNCNRNDAGCWSYQSYYQSDPIKTEKLIGHEYLKFTHVVCDLPLDEEDRAYERSCQVPPPIPPPPPYAGFPMRWQNRGRYEKMEADSYQSRHAQCYTALLALKRNFTTIPNGFMGPLGLYVSPSISVGLPVAFVQTCRQIHYEASPLIYTTNTFAFHEGRTLDLFFSKAIPARYSRLVQSIHADGWLAGRDEPYAMKEGGSVGMLEGLKRLHVCVPNANFPGSKWTYWGVKSLCVLPLEKVKVQVIVSPTKANRRLKSTKRRDAEKIERSMKEVWPRKAPFGSRTAGR